MATAEARKRKACQSCTRAKAKCSPLEDRSDICYRCQRLNKQCVFEETVRKPGPKSRSRVQRLEQRVDSLIDLLSAGHSSGPQATRVPAPATPPTSNGSPEDTSTYGSSQGVNESSVVHLNDEEASLDHPHRHGPPPKAFDPVDAGLITEHHAAELLDEFRTSFVFSFPFVVIDPSVNVTTFRRQQPFLFHAIMTVTTYRTPGTSKQLAEELKQQIGKRVVAGAEKSLEMLQGLLVFAAWYHSFYCPSNQQLSSIVLLCVALVQDLGLGRNFSGKGGKLAMTRDHCGWIWRPDASSGGKRAFLGTFFVSVAFAQAWRNRGGLPYTKFMARCCQALREANEVPTDELITPLIQLCELLARVNDHFSYDDIESAEIKGAMMLEMSTGNFLSELERIKASVPPTAKFNPLINMNICLLEIWINECSLHSSLWPVTSPSDATTQTSSRYKLLYRTMNAVKSYLNTLLVVPHASLYPLSFTVWSGWFYTVIVACKLVFLQENERLGCTNLDDMPQELCNLVPENTDTGNANAVPGSRCTTASWDPQTVARESGIEQIFEKFREKFEFALPAGSLPWTKELINRDALYSIACLQSSLLMGFGKRMKKYDPSASEGPSNTQIGDNSNNQMAYPAAIVGNEYLRPRQMPNILPYLDSLNFDSLSDAVVTSFTSNAQQAEAYDDWIFSMVMDDFTLPGV